MPDITSLLELAAAEPTGAPDVEGPYGRARRHHVVAVAAALVIVIGIPALFVLTTRSPRSHVVVSTPQSPGHAVGQPFHDPVNGFSAELPQGWYRANGSLTPWLTSPREILSAGTAPLKASTQKNPVPAQCDNQLPQAGVNTVGDAGVYVWVTDGVATGIKKPAHAADVPWIANCSPAMPAGARDRAANFDVDGHGVMVIIVTGPHTSAERLAQAYALVDSLRFDPPADLRFHDKINNFDITVAPNFVQSTGVLAPWLASPHDILSLATVRLSPLNIPEGTNGAACPSEVPKVVVDGIGRSGAYLSIREWIPGQGLYQAETRPTHAADLQWARGCALPDGMTVSIATFRDGHRDFTVTVVLGRDAAAARTTIYGMLDSFRPVQ